MQLDYMELTPEATLLILDIQYSALHEYLPLLNFSTFCAVISWKLNWDFFLLILLYFYNMSNIGPNYSMTQRLIAIPYSPTWIPTHGGTTFSLWILMFTTLQNCSSSVETVGEISWCISIYVLGQFKKILLSFRPYLGDP